MLDILVSIIVPVYNSAGFLDKCINSLVSQTYHNLEIILVNDGSVDNSGEICNRWSLCDTRIKVIHQSNMGVAAARNRGITAARGDYLMFLDSDDSLSLDACARVVEYAESHAADCVVFGFLQESGSVWAPSSECVYETLDEFKKDFVVWLNSELLSSSVNKLYKRERVVTPFPEGMSFGEDLMFSLNYIKLCDRISFVPWPIYLHNNLNESSLTHTMRVDRILDIERWQTEILQFIGNESVIWNAYDKYLRDVLFWIKRFYASFEVSKSEKRSFLRQWYKNSHLKGLSLTNQLGMVDRFIIVCLKLRLWLLPSRILNIKHIITGKRKCL